MIQGILTEFVHLFLINLLLWWLAHILRRFHRKHRQAHPAISQQADAVVIIRIGTVSHLIRRHRSGMMSHRIHITQFCIRIIFTRSQGYCCCSCT